MALYKNLTGETTRVGYTVKVSPSDPQAITYSVAGDSNIIGVIVTSVPRYAMTEVATTGVAKVFCYERVVQGAVIRSQKAGDNISRGTCKSATSSDRPYFQIGTALESGKGLIRCNLSLSGGETISNYVPYTGATADVDLGLKDLTATDITAEGTLHAGGSANYIEITSSGEMTFNGTATVWDDLPPVPIIGARLGATAPTLATFVGTVEQYTFDASNDYVIGATEITHGWKEGTVIYPHIHWATNGLEGVAKGVQWQLKYSIADHDEAFSGEATTVIDATIPANTADRTHYISSFAPTINGTNYKIGAYIVWRLNRIATAHAGGAPSSDPFALAIGFHAEQDTVGSKTVGAK